MSNKKIKTETLIDVINTTRDIGDTLANKFEETQDIKVATASLEAYKITISGANAQLVYKKLTGTPKKIDFFEGGQQ